jgi:hypothetical protein
LQYSVACISAILRASGPPPANVPAAVIMVYVSGPTGHTPLERVQLASTTKPKINKALISCYFEMDKRDVVEMPHFCFATIGSLILS